MKEIHRPAGARGRRVARPDRSTWSWTRLLKGMFRRRSRAPRHVASPAPAAAQRPTRHAAGPATVPMPVAAHLAAVLQAGAR